MDCSLIDLAICHQYSPTSPFDPGRAEHQIYAGSKLNWLCRSLLCGHPNLGVAVYYDQVVLRWIKGD